MNEASDEPTRVDKHEEPRKRLRDRVLGIRGVAAVALASVILGGVGGAAIGAISGGVEDVRGGPGLQQAPPQGIPPTTAPDDDAQNS